MSNVLITGWREGLAKVSVTRALQQHAGLGVAAAKRVTDAMLDGQAVTVTCPSLASSATLSAVLDELGALTPLDPDDVDEVNSRVHE